jgi:UDP-2,3-diacylglucosamine hydrolase
MTTGQAPAAPAWPELRAPAAWRAIEFLSDLHLAESTPRTFEALATHLRRTEADAVFILGDLFEVWVGDDARHDGFEARCAALLAQASAQRFVAFMAGNRDFLVGEEMLRHCGVAALHDPTVLVAFGQRALLTHGDALCLADTDYQAFRRQVRGAEWQSGFLAQPLEQRRAIAADIRSESRRRKASQDADAWFDVDASETRRWMEQAAAPWMVHGHTHLPARHPIGDGRVRWVLSDWDFDDGERAPRGDVLRWSAGGFVRMAPATAA